MTTKLKSMLASAASVAALSMMLAAAPVAAAPQGFDAPKGPQGFEMPALNSVAAVKADARDEQMVVLKGRFTKQLSREKFEFVDEKGDMIVCELDDDRDWSMVRKDALMEIRAEVDKDLMNVKLEVESARPL